jgi:hypothetical protein
MPNEELTNWSIKELVLKNPSAKSSDYLLFNDMLDKRNSFIKRGQGDDNQLKKSNEDCLKSLNDIITRIDWIKLANRILTSTVQEKSFS